MPSLKLLQRPPGFFPGLMLFLLLGSVLYAEPNPLENVLPDPRSLTLPPAPVAEKLAMIAAVKKATRLIASVHAEEARIVLIQERSRMRDKAAASLSLADQVTRKEIPELQRLKNEGTPALSSSPVIPVSAPEKPTVFKPPATRTQRPELWHSTAAIQQPPRHRVPADPSLNEVYQSLHEAMDEISQWPKILVSSVMLRTD